MLKNYFKIAYRNILRNKTYSFINIFGLAAGLTSCILIFLFINYDLSFDKFYPKADRIYCITSEETVSSGSQYDVGTPFPFAEAMRNDFPELEAVAQIYAVEEIQVAINEKTLSANFGLFTESSFFEIFDVKFLAGNPKTCLENPNSVILTQNNAEKFFGRKSPLGERIKINNYLELTVSAIVEDVPSNTNLPFSMIASVEILDEKFLGMDMDRWNVTASNNSTFLLLPEKVFPEQIIKGFETFKNKYLSERDVKSTNYSLLPLTWMHYDTRYEYLTYTTSKESLFIFALIALIIILIASINFVNLSIAQSIKRSKEVAIRKVMGAFRTQLIRQYISESANYTLIAFLLAIILTITFLPELNKFLGNRIELNLFDSIIIPIILIGMFVIVSLVTGIYPALVLSRFSPIQALRNKINSKRVKSVSLRDLLVGAQFVISQVLIISVLVISSQLELVKTKDLGFVKDQIINIELPEYKDADGETLKNKLLSNPDIKDVTFAFSAPTSEMFMGTFAAFDNSENSEAEKLNIIFTDEDYLKTFDIKLIAGKFYKNYIEGDTLYKYVINESLLARMNLKNPNEAIGRSITVSRYKGEIIGVVKNFHLKSLHENISPVALTNFGSRYFSNMSVKISSNNVPQTLEFIKENWEVTYAGYIYNMTFYDDFLNTLYESEEKIFEIIEFFAVLAIIIGCLGLLGLMSFIAVQKTKEIGIRKVLGATELNILTLLSKQFSMVILISNIIAWPLAWYIMNKWLENFAFKIDLTIYLFFISGLIGLIIALISVGAQALKASLANPVKSLKYE